MLLRMRSSQKSQEMVTSVGFTKLPFITHDVFKSNCTFDTEVICSSNLHLIAEDSNVRRVLLRLFTLQTLASLVKGIETFGSILDYCLVAYKNEWLRTHLTPEISWREIPQYHGNRIHQLRIREPLPAAPMPTPLKGRTLHCHHLWSIFTLSTSSRHQIPRLDLFWFGSKR